MSVYIPGMEMPKSCRECPFRKETYLLTRQLCMANNDEEICEGIDMVDKSCPLIASNAFDIEPPTLDLEEMVSEAELCISTAELVLSDAEYKEFAERTRELL